MQLTLFWTTAILVLTCCPVTQLNGYDLSAISSFVSRKAVSCYKCSTLTSSACVNISQPENKENLVEECGPKAKGCVKQVAEKIDGTTITFRECYYASISTFLFTNLACENIPRTASYDKATCHKCSGNLCNGGKRVTSAFSSGLSLVMLTSIAFILRM